MNKVDGTDTVRELLNKYHASLALQRELLDCLKEAHDVAHGEDCPPGDLCGIANLITRAEKTL